MKADIEHAQVEVAISEKPLLTVVRDIIDREGPIPFAQFMSYSNYGAYDLEGAFAPGFYTGDRVIGNPIPGGSMEDGKDFTTSPEVTPMFGITLAKQVMEMRELMGEDNFTILEVGGGNGTMAYDILSGLRFLDPEAFDAGKYDYVILDKSEALRRKQAERLVDLPVQLIEGDARSLPQDLSMRGVVLTNELLDDLPADAVFNLGDQIFQTFVNNGSWKFERTVQSPTQEIQSFMDRYQLGIGIRPVSLDIERFMQGVDGLLESGFVMTIDFHHWGNIPYHSLDRRPGASQNSVFERLGGNIWSDVDFDLLKKIGERLGLNTIGIDNQSDYLKRLRINDLYKTVWDMTPEQKKEFGIRYFYGINLADLLAQGMFSVMIQSKGMPEVELAGMTNSSFRA